MCVQTEAPPLKASKQEEQTLSELKASYTPEPPAAKKPHDVVTGLAKITYVPPPPEPQAAGQQRAGRPCLLTLPAHVRLLPSRARAPPSCHFSHHALLVPTAALGALSSVGLSRDAAVFCMMSVP